MRSRWEGRSRDATDRGIRETSTIPNPSDLPISFSSNPVERRGYFQDPLARTRKMNPL